MTDADGAVEAAEHRTGYPLVLKAMGLAHKTEAGGVALSIADADALRAAFARMKAATGADRYAVEAMATPPYGHELIVGVRRDPSFGPVVMVGIGGVTAELLADTALALAPLTPARARALLLRLRHAPLLTGWRGAPGAHLDAAAAAVCAVARAAVDHPELAELEVNPLLVHPGGAIALDAHGVLDQAGAPHRRPSMASARRPAVSWSSGRNASSFSSASVTSTAVPKWVSVLRRRSSPRSVRSRSGTAKPR